ncbi:MAG: DUF6770 family protein [Bacteroidota bacterium]
MKNLILSLILLILAGTIQSQTVQINGVRGKDFRGVKSIEDKGFYTFYFSERAGKGMIEYVLELYDLDLNLIKKVPMQVRKTALMKGGEFNGKDFLFYFIDLNKKTNTFFVIDDQGNIVKEETVPNKKIATAMSTRIFPASDGSGFYVTQSVKEKKWGYQIQKVDRDMQVMWEKTYSRDKGWAGISVAESGNGRLVIISLEKPSLMSKKVMGKVVAFDDRSGDKIYEYELYNGELTAQPTSFLIEDDGTVVTAGMYFDGMKWVSTNSDGVFFLKLKPNGDKEIFNAIDWDNGIQDALKATSRKFSIGSKPKVVFHEIIQSPDGGYQVVSETFRKTVKAGTVLGAMGGGGQAPPMGFTVMDYIIFNYDDQGNPVDINKIEKPYKSALVDGNIASAGGVALAYYMKQFKMFTYEFETELENGDKAIVYTNFEDAKLGTGNPYLGITTINKGEESKTEKRPLSKKYAAYLAGSAANLKLGALKAKPGKVCMYFFDKKKKAINLVLEDLTMN